MSTRQTRRIRVSLVSIIFTAGLLLISALNLCAAEITSLAVNQGAVVIHAAAEPLVKRSAGLLVQELERRNGGKWQVTEIKDQKEALPSAGLVIVLETPGFHPLSTKIKAPPVTKDIPGPKVLSLKMLRRARHR